MAKIEWLDSLFTGSDLFLILILVGLVIILIAALIFLAVQLIKFKHRIIIRNVASSRKYIFIDKFKVIKDEEGVVWWKLFKRKHLIPVAPAEAIEITKKGAMFVEAYYTDEGEYIYQTDEITPKHFNNIHGAVYVTKKANKKKFDVVMNEYKKKLQEYSELKFFFRLFSKKPKKPIEPDDIGRYVYIEDKNKSIKGFNAFTTKQRLILVKQYQKAAQRKKIPILDRLLQLAPLVAIVFILMIMFIFWDNITKPSIEAISQWNSVMEKQNKIIDTMQEIIQKKQILEPAQSPPQDKGPPY